MIFASIIALVFVVLSIVLPLATGGSRYAARVERMLPKTVGLALPVALLPSIRGRNRALVWRLSLGLGAGAIIGLLLSFFIPSAENGIDFAKAWFVMGGVAIGAVVGTCVWVAQEASRRATQDAPLQRPTGVGLFDYLPTWSTVLVVVVLVLALGVGALLVWIASLGVIAPGGEPKFVPIVVAIYGVVVSLIGGLAFITIQLHRPQRAANPEELAWDDALSSQAIFPVVYLAGFFTALLVGQLSSGLSSAIPYSERADAVRGVLFLVIAAPLPVYLLALLSVLAKPARHFLKRLWPAVPNVA